MLISIHVKKMYSICLQNYLLAVVLCNLMIITSCNSGVVFTDLLLPDLCALCPQIPRPCSHRLAILSLVVTSAFCWDWRHVFTDLLFFLLSWHLFFLKCSRRVQISCIWSMHSHCCLLSFTLAHNTWCLALVCVIFLCSFLFHSFPEEIEIQCSMHWKHCTSILLSALIS